MHFPYTSFAAGPDGAADPGQVDAAVAATVAAGATDVLVLSHGWNETAAAAQRLYERLTDQIHDRMAGRPTNGRVFAVIGVIWPAIQWVDLPGLGAAPAGDPQQALRSTIDQGVEDPAVRARLHAASEALHTAAGRTAFVSALRTQLPRPQDVDDDDAIPLPLLTAPAEALFADLARGGPLPQLHFEPFSPEAIARRLINLTGYYAMKARAGRVGRNAVCALLQALSALPGGPGLPRVHLVGHSFGARVVSCAAVGSTAPIHSISLLQGAFSDLAFCPDAGALAGNRAGAFRPALTSGVVRGPIVATHTHNDLAVTIAYAIASRLARQVAELLRIGGADDPYGGIGANGAVNTPEAVDKVPLLARDGDYDFEPGRVHNLLADAYISGHLDVTGPEVANAVLQAVLAVD
jgi:hypothetical protein